MSSNFENASFKKLLNKLQEESWQLELLISGFAIFGLFSAWDAISMNISEAKNQQQVYKFIIALVAQISCAILIFNLLLHVLLRGLWIGALGLRYVSGDIDYEELNYSQKFTKYLKKKVGSFDKYIASLENYCSIIFAVSFILIFYVLSLTFTIVCIALIGNYVIDSESLPGWLSKGVGIPLMLFITIGMLITFLDFITQGFLKKKRWLSRIYFPVYWVFSFITLSFLYRPLVYNLLDNKFGRRLSFLLVPLFLLLFFSMSLYHNPSNYFRPGNSSREYIANNDNYEDLLVENNRFVDRIAIQSKVITDNYIKVFMILTESVENRVFSFNPSLKPENDERGLISDVTFNTSFVNSREQDSLRREYLKTLNSIYFIQIDSVETNPEFVVAKSKTNEFGFETYLSAKGLKEGKHTLKMNRFRVRKSDTVKINIVTIPFWYYND